MAISKRTTLREIAERAETSTMAASVVLNGARSNTRVSEATRRRITEIAAHLNYSPNAMAQGLKRKRARTVGVLFNWAGTHAIHSLYSAAVLDGIVKGAAIAGYHVLLYTTSWKNAAESSAPFSDRRTDGVIVVAPGEASDVISGLAALGVPVAVLSSVTDLPGVPFVAINNRTGVRLALDHLRALGHERIAFAGYGLDRVSLRERHATFLDWIREQGITVPDSYVMDNLEPGRDSGNAERFEELLRRRDRPTAVFAITDDLAAEVLETARKTGLSVPGDLSLVGFDDILLASLTAPKLTTVRLPLLKMGQEVTRLLIEVIEKKKEFAHKVYNPSYLAEPELIVRASTASPPAAI